MNFDRDAFSIVPDGDFVLIWQYFNFDLSHGLVSLEIVRSINKNLILKSNHLFLKFNVLTKYFVEAGDVVDFPKLQLLRFRIKNPQTLILNFDAADVGVGTEEDVLELGLFLVNFFNFLRHFVIAQLYF